MRATRCLLASHASPASRGPSLWPASSPPLRCVVPVRCFSRDSVPVDMSRCPDGVYRRPPVPMPRAPLGEDDELTWSDGQAPEPCLDRYADVIAPRRALLLCLSALALLVGGVSAAVRLVDPAALQPTQPQRFPFDQLAEELGGPARAAANSDTQH